MHALTLRSRRLSSRPSKWGLNLWFLLPRFRALTAARRSAASAPMKYAGRGPFASCCRLSLCSAIISTPLRLPSGSYLTRHKVPIHLRYRGISAQSFASPRRTCGAPPHQAHGGHPLKRDFAHVPLPSLGSAVAESKAAPNTLAPAISVSAARSSVRSESSRSRNSHPARHTYPSAAALFCPPALPSAQVETDSTLPR